MMTMTIDRFDELAAIHGAEIRRWPQAEQAAAKALAGTSPAAQAVLEREQALDDALSAWDTPAPSEALMARILGDAAEVSLSTVNTATIAPQRLPERTTSGILAWFSGISSWRPAGAMAACLAAGFSIGIYGAPLPDGLNTPGASEDNAIIANFFSDDDDSDPFDLEIL